jgi:hypothetical protein
MLDLKGALAWRYGKYVTPHLDMHGSLPLYLARKLRNRWLRGRSHVVYLYAGRGNVGDYLSHLGVREVVRLPGLELFAGRPGSRELARTVTAHHFRERYRVLVIGGGGLFQGCFDDFWRIVLASRLPYVVFGVGANKLGGQRSVTDASLLADIVRGATYIQVRDTMTREAIRSCGVEEEIPLGLCPATSYVYPRYWLDDRSSRATLLHVVHPSDLRMAQGDLGRIGENLRAQARELELSYVEEDNMSARLGGVLGRYAGARLVVSSRLHGCIISYAMGIPFVPLRCDEKIEAFLQTHFPSRTTVEVQALHERDACRDVLRGTLETFGTEYRGDLEREVRRNRERGAKIREDIVAKALAR